MIYKLIIKKTAELFSLAPIHHIAAISAIVNAAMVIAFMFKHSVCFFHNFIHVISITGLKVYRLASSGRVASGTHEMWGFLGFAVTSAVNRTLEDLPVERKSLKTKDFVRWLQR
jgi:hypothetical protein